MKRSRHTWALLALALVPLATSVTCAVPARADVPSPWGGCASVKVVGVRGTAEDFSDDTLGMGTEMYQLFSKVKDDLPGVQVVGTGLWYPAAQWTSAKFFQSIGAGVTQLIMAMDAEAQNCPQEKVVLIGYSQGAAVLGDYLDDVFSTSAATNILAAAVLWADPNFNQLSRAAIPQSDGLTIWQGVLGPRDNTAEQRDYPWVWDHHIVSFCLENDPVCNAQRGTNLGDLPIHGSYPQTSVLPDSASDIATLVRAAGPVGMPPPSPPPYPPTPGPASPPPPPMYGLFDYNPSTGASFVDLPDGLGGWAGIRGPAFSTGWNVYPGDFDADGLTDLFVYNPTSGASYVELADGNGGWTGIKGPAFSPGWNVYTGNLDGNNRTDLFVYNPTSGASYVELADGSGGWTGIKGPAFSPGWKIYTGDFDGNGKTDLFDYNPTTGASYVDLANGSGGWTGIKGPAFSPGWNVYTGNLDGNNRTDLFVYNPTSGASYVELANGNGGWTGIKGPAFSPGWKIYTGDFDGNGKTDLFDYNPTTGASYVDLANGSGGWTGVQGPAFSTGWHVYTGDFTGNGKTDLFVYNPTSGASYVELADGSGGWTGVQGPTFSAGWSIYPGVFSSS